MSEENREQHYAFELVRRYEQMLAKNESYYFDIEQFEDIIDFYCSENKFNTALKVIEYAYTLFPDNSTMLLREAQLLAGMGSLGKALTRLRLLEKFEPRNTEVYLTMASIHSQLRDHKRAVELYKKALALNDAEFEDEIYLEIALEYENMDRFEKAIEILQEALAKNPENESLLYELAYCYEVSERVKESMEYYSAFIEKFPYSFPGWYNLGNSHQRLSQFARAVECYDYCLAIQDDFVPAYINKAHALFKLARYNEAIQVFEETYVYDQPTASVYCYIGECFEKMGEYDKAVFYYRKSLQQDEMYPDAYVGLGLVMGLQEQSKEGLTYLQHATTLDPENVDYQLFYAEALIKTGDIDRARGILETLVQKHPDNEDVWLDFSDFYICRKEMEKGLEVIEEGWMRNRDSTVLAYRKVAYLMMSGKSEEANRMLHKLLPSDPQGTDELEEYYPAILNNVDYIDLCKTLKP